MKERVKIRSLLLRASLRSLNPCADHVDLGWEEDVIRANDPDWEIYPILYHGLKNNLLPPAPEKIEKKLEQVYLAVKANADLQFLLLEDLLGRTLRAGVKVCLLKGAVLAKHYYPDISLRPMGDIDLLVPVRSRETMHRIMKEAGGCYQAVKWSHDRYIFPEAENTPVEVHQRLIDPRSMMQRHLFPTGFLQPFPWDSLVPLYGGSFRLPLESEYDYLYLHALKEGYKSLKWMIDISLMNRTEGIRVSSSQNGFARNAGKMMKDISAELLGQKNSGIRNLLWRQAVLTGAGGKPDRPARFLLALACRFLSARED